MLPTPPIAAPPRLQPRRAGAPIARCRRPSPSSTEPLLAAIARRCLAVVLLAPSLPRATPAWRRGLASSSTPMPPPFDPDGRLALLLKLAASLRHPDPSRRPATSPRSHPAASTTPPHRTASSPTTPPSPSPTSSTIATCPTLRCEPLANPPPRLRRQTWPPLPVADAAWPVLPCFPAPSRGRPVLVRRGRAAPLLLASRVWCGRRTARPWPLPPGPAPRRPSPRGSNRPRHGRRRTPSWASECSPPLVASSTHAHTRAPRSCSPDSPLQWPDGPLPAGPSPGNILLKKGRKEF